MPSKYLLKQEISKVHSLLLFFYHLPTLLSDLMILVIYLSNILRMAPTISLTGQECLNLRGKE